MKWKKMISLLLVATLIGSLFVAFGSGLASADGEYVDSITIEVRMDQSVGIGDTAGGELDVFLQAVTGGIYEGVDPDWQAQIRTLESYGSYNNMYYNSAHTVSPYESEVDAGVYQFNPWAIREIRYATNWLINRQEIVEEIYDGWAIPQYSALGLRNPAWDEYLQPVIDDHGITFAGDREKAIDMITTAMEEARDSPDLEGELQMGDDYWEYRQTADDAWEPVETVGLVRIEDERLEIGLEFADRLEEAGIKVETREVDRTITAQVFFEEPAILGWGFYTGGWIASAAVAFQHTGLAQMYSPFYGFQPGGFVFGDYIFQNETLDDLGMKLFTGAVEDMDEYWEDTQDLMWHGVNSAHRVFISTSRDVIPLNRHSVKQVATDVVTGWSDIFSPRTIMTDDGHMHAAQYSAGQLYMDNWNAIDGSRDYYSQLQQRMTRDHATYLHPGTGLYMPMRVEEYDVYQDFAWEEGELIRNVEVPSDAVQYDVGTEEWYEVGDDLKTANRVIYDWSDTLGTWHSGHPITIRELAGYYAWARQLAFGEAQGGIEDDGKFHAAYGAGSRPVWEAIKALEFDEDEQTITIYGDYTFPHDDQVAGYYAWMNEVPLILYEGMTHLYGETEFYDAVGEDRNWMWGDVGDIWIHWLSRTQGEVLTSVLEEIIAEDWIPYGLREEANPPVEPLTPSELEDEINAHIAFFDEFEHYWISNGPFRITEHDPANLVIGMERWTEDDGYPWPRDYWRDRLRVARLRLGSMDAPRRATQGEEIPMRVRATFIEEFPVRSTRALRDTDEFMETPPRASIADADGTIVWESEDVDLVGGYFEATVPSNVTADELEPGTYEVRIDATLDIQIDVPRSSSTVIITEEEVPEGLVNHFLLVTPDEGEAPLDVVIDVSVENIGEEDETDWVYIGGEPEFEVTVPAGETVEEEFEYTFEDEGEYEVTFGDQSVTVTVEEDTPGFTFLVLAVSAVLAVVFYHVKKRR